MTRSSVTFHGEQVIKTVGGEDSPYIAVPRTEVRFHGGHVDKTVVVDEKGFYQADLPIGIYQMTTEGPKIGGQALTQYVRVFRVDSPTNVVLNGTLYLGAMTCDILTSSDDPAEAAEEVKDNCGGADSYLIPSKDGTPFELYVEYRQRRLTRTGFTYGNECNLHSGRPVFVAYNLFSLEADVIHYNAKRHILMAGGNIVTADGSGTTHHANTFGFRIEDGQVIPLK